MTTERPSLGIVVPMANEESTAEAFLDRVRAQIDAGDQIFCVFDNVCRDRSRDIVTQLAQADPQIVVVWAPENRCVVDAYCRGYRAALDAGSEWILEMDGGLSHRPEEIPRFIEAMRGGVDFAAGSRFTTGGSYRGRLSRRVLSQGGTILSNLLLGTRMKDMTSGFQCFTRRALAFVLETGIHSRGHFFQTEIRYMLRDWDCVEVPISYSNPSKSVGGGSIRDAFSHLWRLRRETRGGTSAPPPSKRDPGRSEIPS